MELRRGKKCVKQYNCFRAPRKLRHLVTLVTFASALLHHLALIARDAGISALHAHTLPETPHD